MGQAVLDIIFIAEVISILFTPNGQISKIFVGII